MCNDLIRLSTQNHWLFLNITRGLVEFHVLAPCPRFIFVFLWLHFDGLSLWHKLIALSIEIAQFTIVLFHNYLFCAVLLCCSIVGQSTLSDRSRSRQLLRKFIGGFPYLHMCRKLLITQWGNLKLALSRLYFFSVNWECLIFVLLANGHDSHCICLVFLLK